MHRYETLFVLHSELSEDQVREANDRFKRLVEERGGELGETQEWGLRDLAYPIRKQSRGTYVLMQYKARPDTVKELERTMKLTDEILRFVSVRVPEAKKASPRSKPPHPTPKVESEPVEAMEQGS